MNNPELLIEKSPQSQLMLLASDSAILSLVEDISTVRYGVPSTYEIGDIDGFMSTIKLAFDFRDGKERHESSSLEGAEQFVDRIGAVADKLGLTGDTIPKNPNADAVIILGGAGKSPLDRTAYAKELLDKGLLNTGTIALLGNSRPVDTAEKVRAGAYARDATTEYELMQNAATEIFGVTFENDDEYLGYDGKIPDGFESGWKISHATTADDTNIFVLQAPMLTDDRLHADGKRRKRANTADTYNLLAKVAGLEPGSEVVAVTNAHFKPFQGADAVAELGQFGIKTDVVGYDPSHFGNPPKKPEELLQETVSAVNSLFKAWRKATKTITMSQLEK